MRTLLILVVLLLPACQARAQDFAGLDAAAGLALFERPWASAPSSTAAADGLGPYYTARSCAACHEGGGAGAHELTSMNLVVDDPVYGQLLQLRAVQGLAAEAAAELREEEVMRIALEEGEVVLRKPVVELVELRHGDLQSKVSLRRAPALHGLALLTAVGSEQLQALADPDDRNGDGISGRLPANAGRFGWKAGGADLRTQVARALSFDIGLGNPLLPAAAGDCTPSQTECLEAAHATAELEFSPMMLQLLLSYLHSLPVPVSPGLVQPGSQIFTQSGCAKCHVSQLDAAGRSIAPFSDLLLHDMGPGLDDGFATAQAEGSEWRTAPLWNLRVLARFLHDGRAATLSEAILWHGGEAAASVVAYRQLNKEERALLHAWLLGL